MTATINVNGDMKYINDTLALETANNDKATAVEKLIMDPETKKTTEDTVEEHRPDKRLLMELKRTLEFYTPFQNVALVLDVTPEGKSTLLGVHPDSGSSFNVFVNRTRDDFVYDLHIAINEVPLVTDKPNTLAVHTLNYINLTYRELGLVLNHPATLNRLVQHSVYETENDFVKTVYGPLRRR